MDVVVVVVAVSVGGSPMHGESASLKKHGPHSVGSAARDVLQLMGQLRLTPRVLIGHSFGGKGAPFFSLNKVGLLEIGSSI